MKKLQAPEEYWQLDDEEKTKLLNQCGPDGPLNSLVPDHLFGLKISSICDIHDFTFTNAKSSEDHRKSDQLFLKNMNTAIEAQTKSKPLVFLRKSLAYIYYLAVRIYSSIRVMTTSEVSEKNS